MKTISVNIVMTYPVHWSRYQILRDFVQNFYDAVGYNDWRSRFRYTYSDSTLSMWVEDISFNYEWLLHIGASSKTGHPNDFAGFFGEGFKIASLCAFRDMGWTIQMMSDNWHITVTSVTQRIDDTPVQMLAYDLSAREQDTETKLILSGLTANDYDLFLTVLDSFFSPDNPIMGKPLWLAKEGAVFLRSRDPINENLPSTHDFGRKGAVFCGYQMLGTNPFGLVICLHRYRKEDRERNSLYSFDVIHVFEEISGYVDPECAFQMLEKMRRYWNSYPQRKYDIHSWSTAINILIRKVASSPEVRAAFVARYENLLCLRRLSTVSERNRRWQAQAWLDQQSKKYTLVKDTFQLLGYPLLEEECERNGGFVNDDSVNALQEQCFIILEEICRTAFSGFFLLVYFPERKIITNTRAVYHGMAVTYRKRHPLMNSKGLKIRSDIGKIYLKASIFTAEGYYDGLSTYLHELCHMFGGDASSSFSLALTYVTEILMENQEIIQSGKNKWLQLFKDN